MQRRIQKAVKHLRWSLAIFAKSSISDVSECSKYAPDMDKLGQVMKASVLENN